MWHPDEQTIRFDDLGRDDGTHVGGKSASLGERVRHLGARGVKVPPGFATTAHAYWQFVDEGGLREGFALECRAIRRLREEMGFDNVVVMIPFCRPVGEADRVLEILAEEGLRRGKKDLKVYVMAEIPSNVILAPAFAERFDGFSIGSNDLTQLTLGVDRDSDELAELFDEQGEAVKWIVGHVIAAAREAGARIGLIGQGPSDHPEFARFLVECGIDAISVTPDSFIRVKKQVARAEAAHA